MRLNDVEADQLFFRPVHDSMTTHTDFRIQLSGLRSLLVHRRAPAEKVYRPWRALLSPMLLIEKRFALRNKFSTSNLLRENVNWPKKRRASRQIWGTCLVDTKSLHLTFATLKLSLWCYWSFSRVPWETYECNVMICRVVPDVFHSANFLSNSRPIQRQYGKRSESRTHDSIKVSLFAKERGQKNSLGL